MNILLHRERGASTNIITNLIHLKVLDRPQSKDVIKALLHAVLFHRLFGIVKPQTFEIQDTTFVSIISWSLGLNCDNEHQLYLYSRVSPILKLRLKSTPRLRISGERLKRYQEGMVW